jgi:hypothetical protein
MGSPLYKKIYEMPDDKLDFIQEYVIPQVGHPCFVTY